MPLGSQPNRARGTFDRPYSALNLRLLLASFGLVSCGALAVLLARADFLVLAVVLGVLAGVAAVDIVVIQLRRRQRNRTDQRRHSLFE